MPPMGMGMHSKSMSSKKEKMNFHALKKTFQYCRKYYVLLIIAVLLAICYCVLTVIGPNRISDLFNLLTSSIATGVDMNVFIMSAVQLLAIYVSSALAHYGMAFILAYVSANTTKNLRRDFTNKINRLPLNYFDTTLRGDILSTVTNDVDAINQCLSSTMMELMSGITLLIGITIAMFVSNWILAFITIGGTLLGILFVIIIVVTSQKYFNRYQNDLGAVNGRVEEAYTNFSIVRFFYGFKYEKEMFSIANEKARKNCMRSQYLSGSMMPIMIFSTYLTQGIMFIVGSVLLLNNSSFLTPGTVISFLVYAKLFSQPLSTLSQNLTSVQQASAGSERVFNLLEEEELSDESNKTNKIDNIKGQVNFNNVAFSYEKGKEIIHNFSIKLKEGQKVAIVGPTGAGKTTIVNLLMRFYEVDSGSIEIDGISTKDIKREYVHDCFDMILQDTWLFQGTVRENLAYNNKNVSDEDIKKACNAVGLKHFLSTLPKGLDAYLDEKITISEGQKQQLTIARAMIKNAPLLILDEATSSVDTRTELIIQKAMDELTKGRTSFIIAHRLSTIKNADIILVLDKGDIVECGNHKELLAKNGRYAELYNSQFEQV